MTALPKIQELVFKPRIDAHTRVFLLAVRNFLRVMAGALRELSDAIELYANN